MRRLLRVRPRLVDPSVTSPVMLSKAKPSWNRSRKSSTSRRGSACRLSTDEQPRPAPGLGLEELARIQRHG
jgi:hypothetical protein